MADFELRDLSPASLARFKGVLTPETQAALDSIGANLAAYTGNISRAGVSTTTIGADRSGPSRDDTHISISVIDKEGTQFAFAFPTDGGAPKISYAKPDDPANHIQVSGDTSRLAGVQALAEMVRVTSTNGFTAAEKQLLAGMGNQILAANGIIPQPKGISR